MISKVIMTRLAQNQLSQYIGYIKQKFKNPQAAKAVAQDARETKALLLKAAETLKPCGDPDLRALGYRVILFRQHRYLFVYSIHVTIQSRTPSDPLRGPPPSRRDDFGE